MHLHIPCLIFGLFCAIRLTVNAVNVYSATLATGGTLKEISHPFINKVSNEIFVHRPFSTTPAVPESGITVYVDV